METFSSGGFKIAYDDINPGGRAGTFMLVHGFVTNRTENWKRLGWYTAFERKDYRVIALDHRGHGDSDKPHDPEAYNRLDMARDVINLMDHVGLEWANVMGYSMGAHLSLSLARDHAERLGYLILGGIGGTMLPGYKRPDTGRPPPNMTMAEAMLVDDPEKISDATQKGFRQFAINQGEDLKALAACTQGKGVGVTPEDMAKIKAPTLVVAGSHDHLAGDPAALAAAIPGAKSFVIPNTDHFSAIPHVAYRSAVFDYLEGWMDEDLPDGLR